MVKKPKKGWGLSGVSDGMDEEGIDLIWERFW